MGNWVSGTFQDPDRANSAFDELIALGYPREKIDVVMSDTTRARYYGDDEIGLGRRTARAAAGGAAIGGALGVVAGAFATVATVSTGGIAAPLVAGPLAATLLAAGRTAAAGGIVGAIVGAGVPPEEAKKIERDVESGAIVLGVDANPVDVDQVRAVLSGR